ncbi:16S rRNA (guanine(966)-N(2))-methyltransferase RsmD [Saccharicrinis carchari]|uniref:16S rRNA (Guanine(966)-N(2))-methyltransferase RsmD n=1 Tax=Saccharicrinis carchari TaxID=1168039 RepID=A0A521AQ50_SACCC|nr:RsmD family RNA methyltransferase [Saccharicrinis carchari]SMO36938.1 16S rRNA (guanine(966)-N(2))-methyltransferase RsmD [Saccharicrinis carchari]
MRIVSGSLKGRRFSPPKSFKARPTTDFAKENLFNVLGNTIDFNSLKVLDLFGGTGSISYEFCSRGATEVSCVELSYNHFKFIKNTAAQLGLEKNLRIFKGNVFKFIEKTTEKYDLIFADPPYDLITAEQVPDLIFKHELLKDKGLLIFEHSGKLNFKQHPKFIENREYGKVIFTFFSA